VAACRNGNIVGRVNKVTSGPVSTGMGDHLRWINNLKPPGPTQTPSLSGTGNEYQPKCGDAQLGSKGRYGSFHLWINMWVAGKTV